MTFRFIHTADIHLDSPLRSLAMRNGDLAELIGNATREAFVSIVNLCLEERVDALIIAGDLYDGEQTSMKTARFLAGQLQRLHGAGVETFVIRGNHDALSRITQELILPPSVKLFAGRAETVELSRGLINVAIHGLSFAKPQAPDSLLPKYRGPVAGAVNIGIMHTSLAGAPGHDLYAPCNVSDLHGWGYDYWALGHVHLRAQHIGERTVIMPGMPQGRDINESGPKTVSLVTVADDRSILVEERLTSIAQFERIDVDLTPATTWRDAVELIEKSIGRTRDAARSPHLVGRLHIGGSTPLAWRLRRDRDLLLTEVQHRAESLGKTWIEKLELSASAPRAAAIDSAADPVVELGALMHDNIIAQHGVRETVRELVEEIRNDLPAELRSFAGDDEAAFNDFVEQLLRDGSDEILARLKPHGEDAA
jgi:exonuclease SbcD